MVSGVEGRTVLLEGRVRLRGELGVICWAVKAGFRWKGRRRKCWFLAEEERENVGGSRALDCSLSRLAKGLEGGGWN